MGLFSRIGDIISANLNDLTDSFEDPEVMLRQAIREMETSINEVTEQTAKAMASQKTMQRELDRNRQQAEQWQGRAERAVAEGDDELARRALSRKREHEKLAAALEDQLAATRDSVGTLRRQLDAMKAKLAEAKRSYATLSARKRAADFRKKMSAELDRTPSSADSDAFSKFDRLREKVEQAEAEAEALAELRQGLGPAGTQEAEVDVDFDTDLDIDAELAELKRKQNG